MTEIDRPNLPDLIVNQMLIRIRNNYWKVDEKLPSEHELSKEFGVNRLTVRLAINKLNTLGLVETKQGKGTFVKKFDLYNYLNQIIPYVISSNEISYIIDFENLILDDVDYSLVDVKKINLYIDSLNQAIAGFDDYSFTKKIDNIAEHISSNIMLAKEEIISCHPNKLMSTIYMSLTEPLRINIEEELKDLDTQQTIKYVDNFITQLKRELNIK